MQVTTLQWNMTVLTFVLQRQEELKPMELSQNELKLVACIPVSSPHCHHVPDATQARAASAVGTQKGHRGDTEHPPTGSAAPVCISSQPGGSCSWNRGSQKWAAIAQRGRAWPCSELVQKAQLERGRVGGGLMPLPVQDRQHLAMRDGLQQLWHKRK